MSMDFSKFEKKLNINFKNKKLLRQAFTHRSYVNENPGAGEHNERLEFLGDAVLELIITRHLYDKYPDKAEGELTSYRSGLVNTNTLSETASKIDMNEFLLLSKGESKDIGRARQYILANTFEALIGAIYLDLGYDIAYDFIADNLFGYIDDMVDKKLWKDAKSFFQEKAQDIEGVTPHYKLLKEDGPDHAKEFTVGVYIGDNLVGEGVGLSKQDAEQKAAEDGLKKKEWYK
ncbi:MAG: ribonuclease III [Parcubacteria group bacterium CG10_big_fil_rev_8_21_14_0_10_38_31]|nr:MAG: ribonuclease III [Parcubacteria group bacterium CG10_big_fil_rev_8_21_14_0_10_38_31]